MTKHIGFAKGIHQKKSTNIDVAQDILTKFPKTLISTFYSTLHSMHNDRSSHNDNNDDNSSNDDSNGK